MPMGGGHVMGKNTHGPVAGGHRRDFLRLGAYGVWASR